MSKTTTKAKTPIIKIPLSQETKTMLCKVFIFNNCRVIYLFPNPEKMTFLRLA